MSAGWRFLEGQCLYISSPDPMSLRVLVDESQFVGEIRHEGDVDCL